MRAAILAALPALALACDKAVEAPVETKIAGVVRDRATEAPLAGVQIAIEPSVGAKVTGEDGAFEFAAGLTPGETYRIRGTRVGYLANEVTVRALEGETVRADLSLAPHPPVLAVTPQDLDFGADRTTLTLALSNTGGAEPPLAFTVTKTADWMSVRPAAGTLGAPLNVEVLVDRGALGAAYGRYDATLLVTSNGGSVSVPVRLDHEAPPALRPSIVVTPSALDFGAVDRQVNLTIQNLGTGPLAFTISSDRLFVRTSTGGQLPPGRRVELDVRLDRDALPVGVHEASLAVTSDDPERPRVVIPIRAEVLAAPRLVVAPAEIELGADRERAELVLENAGTGPLDFELDLPALAWVQLDGPTTGTLGPGAKTSVALVATRAGLPPGPYETILAVRGGGAQIAVPVRANIDAVPRLEVTPAALELGTGTTGAFTLANVGYGPLTFAITSADAALSVVPPSGELSRQAGSPPATARVDVTLDRAGLPPGPYAGSLAIETEVGRIDVRVTASIPLGAWSAPTLARSPPRRKNAAFAFADGAAVLFGGEGAAGPLGDTWIFDGAVWTEDTRAPRPPARARGALAHDPTSGRLILYGGSTSSRDVYAYTASVGWSRVPTDDDPSPASAFALWTPGGRLVLAGGKDSLGAPTADYAELVGSGWQSYPGRPLLDDVRIVDGAADLVVLGRVGCPAACALSVLRFSPALEVLADVPTVLADRPGFASFARGGELYRFGGTGASPTLLEVVDTQGWVTAAATNVGPPTLSGAAMVYDPALDRAILFGGEDTSGLSARTWILDLLGP